MNVRGADEDDEEDRLLEERLFGGVSPPAGNEIVPRHPDPNFPEHQLYSDDSDTDGGMPEDDGDYDMDDAEDDASSNSSDSSELLRIDHRLLPNRLDLTQRQEDSDEEEDVSHLLAQRAPSPDLVSSSSSVIDLTELPDSSTDEDNGESGEDDDIIEMDTDSPTNRRQQEDVRHEDTDSESESTAADNRGSASMLAQKTPSSSPRERTCNRRCREFRSRNPDRPCRQHGQKVCIDCNTIVSDGLRCPGCELLYSLV